jgi:hypothetical protein
MPRSIQEVACSLKILSIKPLLSNTPACTGMKHESW